MNFHEKIRRADLLFSQLQFAPVLPLYKELLDDYPVRDSTWFRVLHNLVECYYWQHDGLNAEKLIRDNLPFAVHKLGPAHPHVGDLYLQLAIVGFISSTTAMTEEYFQKALRIAVSNFGLYHESTAIIYEWLGTYHESFNDKANSYCYLNQARSIRRKLYGNGNTGMGNTFRYLGLYHKRYAHHDSALCFLQKALGIFDKQYGPYNFQSVKCLNNISKVQEDAGKSQEALALFQEALRRISKAKGEMKMASVMTWCNLSEWYARQNDYRMALKTIQNVYPYFFPEFSDTSFLKTPLNIANGNNHYLRLTLDVKSEYLIQAYKNDPHHPKSYLYAAFQCDSLVSDYLFRQKIRIANYDNLLAFEQRNTNVYYTYGKRALELYSIDPQKKFLSAALSYFERYRNMQMALRMKKQSTFFYEKEDPVFQSERARLLATINDLHNRLSRAGDEKMKKNLTGQLIDKKIALDQFFYSHLILQKQAGTGPIRDIYIDIEEVRKKLPKGVAIFYLSEFFPDYIFVPDEFTAIIITKEHVEWKFLKGSEVYHEIEGFTGLMNTPASSVKSIQASGYRLFQTFFGPFTRVLDGISRLVVVPAPDTWLLPFEAFSIAPPESHSSPRYLISEMTVQKVFSLFEWLTMEDNHSDGPVKLLAFAPKFNKPLKNSLARITRRDTAMIDLPGAHKECRQISQFFPSTLIDGYNATKGTFIKLAPGYEIIHLSTHGIPLIVGQPQMTLAFNNLSGSSSFEGNMNFYEILNMRLKSQLVVLSACKSAMGEKNKSEGSLNLAWAFKNAGTKSVIVSIWDANDYTSSVIMPGFYRYLSEGLSKPEALRKAKLDFLAQADKLLQHPYYWAGFDFIGDGSPVAAKQPLHVLFWFVLAVILSAGISFLFVHYRYGGFSNFKNKLRAADYRPLIKMNP